MDSLPQRALKSIQSSRLLVPGEVAGVAVSGGSDSVALLRLLFDLRQTLGVKLAVVHFDHGLRGEDSRADSEFVAALGRKLGLEVHAGEGNVRSVAREQKWNLEDAARRLRYEFFHRLVAVGAVTRIAVAHTADDQAETVIARLLRGTGPTGLASIYPVVGPIVRPLLNFRRAELRAYLLWLNQEWREDRTNVDLSRQRARVRAKLVPMLETEFSPSVVTQLCRLAELAREDNEFWSALIDAKMRELADTAGGAISFSSDALLAPLPLGAKSLSVEALAGKNEPNRALQWGVSVSSALRPLTERLIRRAYRDLQSGRGELSSHHVDQIIRLATNSASGRQIQLPGGVSVQKDFGRLLFRAIQKQTKARASKSLARSDPFAFRYAIDLPRHGTMTLDVPEVHMRLCLKVIDWPCVERETVSQNGVLDAARLNPPLILRSWQPGDAYIPRKRHRTRKLNHMLLAARVPREERLGWPILESRGEIAWARKLPLADHFGISDSTKVAVLIEEASL